ncbi:MAG: ligand-binding sensor domain-containing protein, partial [Longimicrobiales bacterium]
MFPTVVSGQGQPAFIHGEVGRQLPQQSVTSLLQAVDGRIWIGTQTGLFYYDGTAVRPAEVEGDPDLGGSVYVRSLVQAEDGALWVGTESDGVLIAPPSTRRFVRLDIGSGAVYVEEPTPGIIAIGSDSGLRLVSGTDPFDDLTSPVSVCEDPSPIRSLGKASGGDLLVGTDAGVAARLSPAGRGSVEWCAQLNSPVRSFLAESDGVLVGTLGAGLQKLDSATGVIIETVIPGTAGPGAQVAALHRDRDGTLLVGTFGGLALVDDQDRVEWLVPDPDDPRSLPDASVSA